MFGKIARNIMAQFMASFTVVAVISFSLIVFVISNFTEVLLLRLFMGLLFAGWVGVLAAKYHLKTANAVRSARTGGDWILTFGGSAGFFQVAGELLGMTGQALLVSALLVGVICTLCLEIMSRAHMTQSI